MFEIKLKSENIDLLKSSVSLISELLDEAQFNVSEKGLGLLSADRAMISVVDFCLNPTAFEAFNSQGENPVGINMKQFSDVAKRMKSSDVVSLKLEDNTNTVEIVIEGNGRRTFKIPLLDMTVEKPPVDHMEFDTKVKIKTEVLEDGISDADIVDDSVVFEVKEDTLFIKAKGDVTATSMELKSGENLAFIAKVDARARYPLEYLKKMIKAKGISDEVVAEFKTNYPLKLVFANDKIKMGFVLAPRIEE